MAYLKQAEMEEAWQHLQSGSTGEEQRKGADEELQKGKGCGQKGEVGVRGKCGYRGRECGEHMMP